MRVSCPSCQTEYDVPDAALAGRTRTLRCVTCGNQWVAGPLPVETPAAAVMPPPSPPPMPAATTAELAYINRPRPVETAAPARPVPRETPIPAYAPASSPKRPMPVPQYEDPTDARTQADKDSFANLVKAAQQNKYEDETPEPVKAKGRPSPWLISILILLLIVGLLWLERDNVMRVWPPSIRLYTAIGNALAPR